MDVRPITACGLRVELAPHPDVATVEVLVPDRPEAVRVLRVVTIGYGEEAPDADRWERQ